MKRAGLIAAAVVVVLFVASMLGVLYTVNEAEQVVITRLGKAVAVISEPGLHAKWPMFIDKAVRFDKRFLEWDGDPNQIPTADKRFIYVDTYARWQITDPKLFLERLTSEAQALSRLDDILDGETRNTVARHNLIEVVRTTNRSFAGADETDGTDAIGEISFGRSELADEVLTAASARVEDLGIRVLDFRFKRIDYVDEVQQEVFERMKSERVRIAKEFRSEGEGEAARIDGERERKLKEITSEAYRSAQEIKGRADAEAADIYAAAYNRDPEFYRFLKTMETYRRTLDAETVLILTTEGDFYRYLDKAR